MPSLQTHIGGSNEFKMERAVLSQRVDQEHRLLALNLSRYILDDVLDVKHYREDLYVCSAAGPMSN